MLFFWSQKQCLLSKKCTLTYYTELNLQICNDEKKQRICRENSKDSLDENLMAIFALAERLPTSVSSVVLYELESHKFMKDQ